MLLCINQKRVIICVVHWVAQSVHALSADEDHTRIRVVFHVSINEHWHCLPLGDVNHRKPQVSMCINTKRVICFMHCVAQHINHLTSCYLLISALHLITSGRDVTVTMHSLCSRSTSRIRFFKLTYPPFDVKDNKANWCYYASIKQTFIFGYAADDVNHNKPRLMLCMHQKRMRCVHACGDAIHK